MNRTQFQSIVKKLCVFFHVICNASSCSSESECRPEDCGKSYAFNDTKSFLHARNCRALRNLKPYALHCIFKELPVFSLFYCMKFCADEFNIILFKRSAFSKLNSKVKRGLPAHRRKQRIRPFFLYYQLNDVCC